MIILISPGKRRLKWVSEAEEQVDVPVGFTSFKKRE